MFLTFTNSNKNVFLELLTEKKVEINMNHFPIIVISPSAV